MRVRRRGPARFVSFAPPALLTTGLIAVSLSLVAAFFVGLLIIGNKTGAVSTVLSSRPILLLPLAVALAGLAVAFFLSGGRRRFLSQLGIVALAAATLFFVVEIALRLARVPTELGERIGEVELLPHDWDHVRQRNQNLLRQFRGADSFYVEDALLGWDVGKNRKSGDYASDAEGIRAANPGDAYSAIVKGQPIALLGDSFTFGEEVAFEETWGHYLERLTSIPVLNFGVPSHGIDQTLLKFDHKVAQWNPAVVILGMLDAAAPRSGNIYLFLRPDQALPFSKPRFVNDSGALSLVNTPVIAGDEIYSRESIYDLPHIEKDALFQRSHWQHSFLDASMLMRYLYSRFPRWDAPVLSDTAAEELSSQLIQSLNAKVTAAGATLLVVFLPERPQIAGGPAKHRDAIAKSLARNGIAIFDPTQCLLTNVERQDLFVKNGVHYSAKGNAALANCLAPEVTRLLAADGK
jgi:hypothetical protein